MPSDDLILLLVLWIKLMDSFDKNKSHEQIIFESKSYSRFKYQAAENAYVSGYVCAIGSFVMKKGIKQSWTFKSHAKYPLIGIMDDDIIQSQGNIEDHTDEVYEGYGLQLYFWNYYHACTKEVGNL